MGSLKKFIATLRREQLARDKLFDEQSRTLLNDLVRTKDVKNLMSLHKNNEKQIKNLGQSQSLSSKDAALVSIMSTQLAEMRELLVFQEKNLIAYKKAAEKKLRSHKKESFLYKTKLDRALKGKVFKNIDKKPVSSDSHLDKDLSENIVQLGAHQKVKSVGKNSVKDVPILESAVLKQKKITKRVPSIEKHADGRDKLTVINKISPKLETLLNNKGITTIAQIAEWTPQDVKARDARLVFRGRISQEKWVDQARAIVKITSKD